jgi:hypothetical protein
MLLAQVYPEQSADNLLSRVLDMRAKAWPNLRMMEFADEQLGRGGELVRAAGRIYRHQVKIRSHIATSCVSIAGGVRSTLRNGPDQARC